MEQQLINICGCSALVMWKIETASVYIYIRSSRLDFEDDRRPLMTMPSRASNAAMMYNNVGGP